MIKIFSRSGNQLVPLDTYERNCWVNVINPEKGELETLSSEMGIPPDFLTDPLDVDERSRVETEDGVLLIVLRIPKFEGTTSEIPFVTVPVGIILVGDMLITVCSSDIGGILELTSLRSRSPAAETRSAFILRIFLKAALLYLKYLKEINKRTNEVEKELQKSLKNEALIKLLNIEKSLVFFTTSLRSNELMMERLLRTTLLTLDPDDKDMLEDVLIDNKQAIEMANIYSNILSGMMDAFASVISNNLNQVMKILTSITIILMIPTLTASIYGMNIELPFGHSTHAFLIVTAISFALSLIGVIFFMKNKWF